MINQCLAWDANSAYSTHTSIEKASWLTVQAVKVSAVAAFSCTFPTLSLLTDLALYAITKYTFHAYPGENSCWALEQFHLYEKVNLVALFLIQEFSLPVFIVLGAISLWAWWEDRKLINAKRLHLSNNHFPVHGS